MTFGDTSFPVTPAFLEARKRKQKNDFTTKGVFPYVYSGQNGTKVADFHNGSLTWKKLGNSPGTPSTARSRVDVSRLSSRINSSGSDQSGSFRKKLLSSRQSHSSVQHINAENENEQIKDLNDWFCNASTNDKELALNILSSITRKPERCCSHHYTPRKRSSVQSNISQRQTSANVQFPKLLSEPWYVNEDVTNIGAVTYMTQNFQPDEFVIHPEWHNRKDQLSLRKLQKHEDEQNRRKQPQYGYWQT